MENRTWPLPARMIGERIYIHAGKSDDPGSLEAQFEIGVAPMVPLALHARRFIPRGIILGQVTITGCVTESDNPWFVGPYGYVLADPLPYDEPIPWKARLGFFDVELPLLPL